MDFRHGSIRIDKERLQHQSAAMWRVSGESVIGAAVCGQIEAQDLKFTGQRRHLAVPQGDIVGHARDERDPGRSRASLDGVMQLDSVCLDDLDSFFSIGSACGRQAGCPECPVYFYRSRNGFSVSVSHPGALKKNAGATFP